MLRLTLILALSTLGGTFLLHYLKNFLLKEKRSFELDWDGLLERLCLTYIILESPQFAALIPLVILLKAVYRVSLLVLAPGISRTEEPGAAAQKVLLKAELAFDLFLSPAFAILIGVLFR
jgi:hypothetical protein